MKHITISKLINITKGRKHSSIDCPKNGCNRYLQIDDLRPDANIKYTLDVDGAKANPEDILIAWDGANAGTIGFALSGYIGSTLARLRPISNDVFSPYIGRFLQSRFRNIRAQCTGATIPHVSRSHLLKMEVPFPPLSEQKRIAAILDQADTIRKKRRQSIDKLNNLIPAIFYDMFGDPVANPKGWDYVKIEAIGKVQGGLQVTRKRNINPIEAPYLRVANVYRGELDLSEIKYMRVTQQELNRTILHKGDILVVEGHGNPQEIGRVAVWNGEIQGCLHQNHLIRICLDHEVATPEYVEAYLNSDAGKRQLTGFGKTTSGLNTISNNNVKMTHVLLPPFDQQRKFTKRSTEIKQSRTKQEIATSEADNLFNSLVQRAFKGEL